MMSELGKLLITLGAVLLAVGMVLTLAGKVPWLGRLPGDLAIEHERFRFYFPLTTCLLLSAVLSFILWLLRR